MYMLGPSIEAFSTFFKSVVTSFDMMNANYPFEDLYPDIPQGDFIKRSVALYFYSFIVMHYFMAQLSHAMVVEAYIDVISQRKEIVALTRDLYDVWLRSNYIRVGQLSRCGIIREKKDLGGVHREGAP